MKIYSQFYPSIESRWLQTKMVATVVAAAYTHIHLDNHATVEVFASKSMELKWVKTRTRTRRITKTTHKQKTLSTPLLPLFISTNPRHLNPHHLQNLCSVCNHSFNRFPNLKISDTPEPVDINKLRIALSHSDVLVSVFCKPHHVDGLDKSLSSVVDFFTPVSPERDLLIGFGRAVSDFGLTASIYDVMVTLAYIFQNKQKEIYFLCSSLFCFFVFLVLGF